MTENVRKLCPRSHRVVASLLGADDSQLWELAEIIDDHDNEASCDDSAVSDGKLVFRVYVDAEEANGQLRAREFAGRAIGWALESCDASRARAWSVVVDEQPLPYTAEENEDNARMIAGWAAVDAIWPTLRPGDAISTGTCGSLVVLEVNGDELQACRKVDSLETMIPVFAGDWEQIVTMHRLGLYSLARHDPFCGHGRDGRLAAGCDDCARHARMYMGGLFKRDVL